ncbi:tRNA 5-methylaminomethyl-2-thiouridine biosynthesis bifunctional protein [Modicisalibacter ilicicola DSM 19980]|uniref:tRNA 5-methylaminomethyl-2-thiouridine biosynthesis bifunctional protein MnmC n=1 Tax=Modicisalibacter ilicicola DSM 19980 TaxID=1121942 RepID=A0A1M4UX27_9GAMM|nr:bifunctional tRNA (5-methylaminomethyl-2-thiouridine)(34)-methyltransferase MnmD/FAD-dependent 5-carboxymethylaminomethyl-2-thiouridine(34) oxidoreductase MnmC [Halomonas ilicicola]SHE61276.1 tRNA 5-methylaminomethyl-2-thiouridine biosynthesis bifunctional protein [Halomonas ilicicola DSM 19980]
MDDRPAPLPPLAALETARLAWAQADDAAEAPHSLAFGDVYFSRQDGRAETEHVFVQGNRLAERFAAWREGRPFVIGETGFGTGLNVLCAWACFDTHAADGARLHLISTEKHPLTRDDLARALAAWPEFAGPAGILIDQWPEPVSGVHRLVLDPRVVLDLHFGDSTERLVHLEGKVDAWFLDGFAPAKNPTMWQPALFQAMAARSRPGTTFATFTCAGLVKRGLGEAGFHWEKAPGFGRKREMLRGHLVASPADRSRRHVPWFTPPPSRPTQHVAVIGAGLAGASTAEALARRGVRVTLLDRQAPGAEASGNRQGALYVKLAAETNLQSRFYLAGLLYTRRLLARLDPQRRLWRDCGVLQLALSAKEARRQAAFLNNHPLPRGIVEGVSAREASRRAGVALSQGGLDYPGAGWVRPEALCQRLAEHQGIDFRRAEVTALAPDGEGWQLASSNGEIMTADQVVVANAWRAPSFAPLSWLPLQPIRGQVSALTLPRGIEQALDRVVCAGGYAMPALEGVQTFGATFGPGDTDGELRDIDHAANLAEFEHLLPAYAEALRASGADLDPAQLQGRVGLRAASPDKSPYAGPVPDATAWRQDYAMLQKNARHVPATPGRHHAGLWISAAHGSRGLASAPLCAEVLASRLCDEPMPLERELVDHLHPGRRLIAEIIRSGQAR